MRNDLRMTSEDMRIAANYALRHGARDFARGYGLTDNPYEAATEKNSWRMGWLAAKIEMETEMEREEMETDMERENNDG